MRNVRSLVRSAHPRTLTWYRNPQIAPLRAGDQVRAGMREFDPSVSSQAVRRPEIWPSAMPEVPANGAHLQIGGRSPGSEFGDFPSHIADSLRRIFEIFPFLGDSDRRPGSISHCVVTASKMPRSSVFFRRSVHGTICISCRIRMGQIGFLGRFLAPSSTAGGATRGPATGQAEIACEHACFCKY